MDILQNIERYCLEHNNETIENSDMIREVLNLSNMYLLQREGELYVEEWDEYSVVRVAIGEDVAECMCSELMELDTKGNYSALLIDDKKEFVNLILFNIMYLYVSFEAENICFVVPAETFLECN